MAEEYWWGIGWIDVELDVFWEGLVVQYNGTIKQHGIVCMFARMFPPFDSAVCAAKT
jgi:hypothetical protein